MPVDNELFIHDSDRAALNALKAIPGFTQLLKGFMKIWNEKQFKILNMSTYLKIDQDQMKKYHDMLLPICRRLGIAVPELYISLNPVPNAYTSGDTEPFIVMTSGLINAVPDELIASVLAHECGHIACHHVLYSTMGRLILNGAAAFLGLSPLMTTPLQMAFYYWMRCSEFSADRAAAVCDGTGEKVVNMCMTLAGYDKNFPIEANKDAFLAQAKEYRDMVSGSAFNKTLEFIMFNSMNHPLNAVRAYECNEWCKTENFKRIAAYLDEEESGAEHKYIPTKAAAGWFLKKEVHMAENELRSWGFTNITVQRSAEVRSGAQVNAVTGVTAGGVTAIKKGEWLAVDIPWVLTVYQPLSADEVRAAHPGQACVPYSGIGYVGRDYRTVVDELRAMGFVNISVQEQADIKVKLLIKEYSIASITINGDDKFEKNSWFDLSSQIMIRYHVMAQN